jgi:hypothetical protein
VRHGKSIDFGAWEMNGMTIRNKVIGLSLFIFITLCSINVLSLHVYLENIKHFDKMYAQLTSINDIKEQLTKVEKELWQIISGNKSGSSKFVFTGSQLYKMLDNINATIETGVKETAIRDVQIKLYLVQKSMDTMTKFVRSLEEQEKSREMDEESTAIYFPGSIKATMFVDSYVDENEKIMNKIGFSKNIINKNIGDYISAGLIELKTFKDSMKKTVRKIMVINILTSLAVLILAFLYSIKITKKPGQL